MRTFNGAMQERYDPGSWGGGGGGGGGSQESSCLYLLNMEETTTQLPSSQTYVCSCHWKVEVIKWNWASNRLRGQVGGGEEGRWSSKALANSIKYAIRKLKKD